MSKAALDQFTKSLSLEVASRGVRVNSVNPGVIVTEIHKRGGMDDEAYKKVHRRLKLLLNISRISFPISVFRTWQNNSCHGKSWRSL